MPFYDYACTSCGKVFDRMVSMERRNENQICPDCGKEAVRKVVAAFSQTGQSGKNAGDSCSSG